MATTTLGQALAERACQTLRECLERLGGEPDMIEAAVSAQRAEHQRTHCQRCGTYITRNATDEPNPCVRCTAPRRPWPKSRQGYRPR